jgi:hypothetical protein
MNSDQPLARLCSVIAAIALCCTLIGCQGDTESVASVEPVGEHGDHEHDEHGDHDHGDDHDEHGDHDHGDGHDDHDHPAHGPNGGHMVDLSGGGHAEWVHNDQKEEILVYVEEPDSVEKIEMTAVVEDQTNRYAFERVEGEDYFRIVSPDLLFAIKMGDAVKTELLITTQDGEQAGAVKHHAH